MVAFPEEVSGAAQDEQRQRDAEAVRDGQTQRFEVVLAGYDELGRMADTTADDQLAYDRLSLVVQSPTAAILIDYLNRHELTRLLSPLDDASVLENPGRLDVWTGAIDLVIDRDGISDYPADAVQISWSARVLEARQAIVRLREARPRPRYVGADGLEAEEEPFEAREDSQHFEVFLQGYFDLFQRRQADPFNEALQRAGRRLAVLISAPNEYTLYDFLDRNELRQYLDPLGDYASSIGVLHNPDPMDEDYRPEDSEHDRFILNSRGQLVGGSADALRLEFANRIEEAQRVMAAPAPDPQVTAWTISSPAPTVLTPAVAYEEWRLHLHNHELLGAFPLGAVTTEARSQAHEIFDRLRLRIWAPDRVCLDHFLATLSPPGLVEEITSTGARQQVLSPRDTFIDSSGAYYGPDTVATMVGRWHSAVNDANSFLDAWSHSRPVTLLPAGYRHFSVQLRGYAALFAHSPHQSEVVAMCQRLVYDVAAPSEESLSAGDLVLLMRDSVERVGHMGPAWPGNYAIVLDERGRHLDGLPADTVNVVWGRRVRQAARLLSRLGNAPVMRTAPQPAARIRRRTPSLSAGEYRSRLASLEGEFVSRYGSDRVVDCANSLVETVQEALNWSDVQEVLLSALATCSVARESWPLLPESLKAMLADLQTVLSALRLNPEQLSRAMQTRWDPGTTAEGVTAVTSGVAVHRYIRLYNFDRSAGIQVYYLANQVWLLVKTQSPRQGAAVSTDARIWYGNQLELLAKIRELAVSDFERWQITHSSMTPGHSNLAEIDDTRL